MSEHQHWHPMRQTELNRRYERGPMRRLEPPRAAIYESPWFAITCGLFVLVGVLYGVGVL